MPGAIVPLNMTWAILGWRMQFPAAPQIAAGIPSSSRAEREPPLFREPMRRYEPRFPTPHPAPSRPLQAAVTKAKA